MTGREIKILKTAILNTSHIIRAIDCPEDSVECMTNYLQDLDYMLSSTYLKLVKEEKN